MSETHPEPWTRDESIPERSACAVKLPVFEGPLDLLLHLIRQNEVDISNIPIAAIADQYLEYLELMQQIDIDVAAEYLVMAATLAHIKSRLLLPSMGDDEEDDGEDPRAELARRLAEFAAFQEAARDLGARPLLGRDVFVVEPDASALPHKDPVLEVSLFQLLEAFRRVLAKLPEDEQHHEVSLERVTLQDRMLAIMDHLNAEPEHAMLLEDLLSDGVRSRHLLIMTFLALLELAKIQALRLFQNATREGRPFGPVRVHLAVIEGEASNG